MIGMARTNKLLVKNASTRWIAFVLKSRFKKIVLQLGAVVNAEIIMDCREGMQAAIVNFCLVKH